MKLRIKINLDNTFTIKINDQSCVCHSRTTVNGIIDLIYSMDYTIHYIANCLKIGNRREKLSPLLYYIFYQE